MGSILWSIAGMAVAAAIGYAVGKRSQRAVSEAPPPLPELPANGQQQLEARLEAQRDAYLQELLQTVSHIRHDWMNDMQVLFGYIQLEKYDYLLPYMEKIRLKLQNESSLAKLGVPSLVAFLLTFRTECRAFELELEFPEEVNLGQLPLNAETVERAVRFALGAFRRHALENAGEPNALSLEFAKEDDALLLDFAYNGQYAGAQLKRELENDLAAAVPGIGIEACELEDRLVSLAIRLPFREPISET
jgi:stage 0 sporulation protein B (sporulation initiation phosphotransferase)